MEALISFCTWTAKKSEFCFKLLGQDIRLTFSIETGVRENELAKELFLDLLSWAWMVPIFLKNSWYSIFFKRTRLEKKLWLFGMFKFGTSIKYWLNVLAISAWFYHLQKINFRKYFDLIWRFRFYHFPKNSIICHLTYVKITVEVLVFFS